MTSTIVPIAIDTPNNEATTPGDDPEPNPPGTRWGQGNTNRLADCGLLAKRCFGEKVRPSAGLCMIAFAVPLVVPGITLTVVAFEDGTEFTKYGALHVLGFVLLISAILLTAVGVLLNTRYKFQITSKDSTPKSSSHDKSLHEADLDISPSPNENLHKTDPLAAVFVPNLPPLKQVADSEELSEEGKHKGRGTPAEVSTSSNNGQKHVSFSARKISRRQFSSNKSFDDNSSSFDSFDSEDFSSGSYILSEDIEWERPIPELESETDTAQDIKPVRQTEDQLKKPVFDFGDLNSYSKSIMDARFSFPAMDGDGTNLSEANNCSQPHPSTSNVDVHTGCHESVHTGCHGHVHTGCHEHVYTGCHEHVHTGCHGHVHIGCHEHVHIGCHEHVHTGCHEHVHTGCHGHVHTGCHEHVHTGCHERVHTGCHGHVHTGCHERVHTGCHGDNAHTAPEHQDGASSPGSRSRLYGLSSEVSVASSDSQITSRDSIKIHDVALKDNSDSNSSVFLLERGGKPAGDTTQDDPSTILVPKSTQLKTWAQSPPTKRPNSFPIGAEMPVSPGRVARNNSLTETHIISLDEFCR